MKAIFLTTLLLLLQYFGEAQKIKYTEGEKEDTKKMNFETVGKFNSNIIIYKNVYNDNYMCVYDGDMKLKEKLKLVNMPINIINVDFISYPTFFYMIYQHQKKNVVYCDAIKFNTDGKKMEDAVTLDTTTLPVYQNDNKIYQILVSDNKQQIGIVKANKKNERNHLFGAILYSSTLQQQYKRRFVIPMDGRNNFLDEFLIDNDGDIYMAKCYSVNDNEYVTKLNMLHIPVAKDTIINYVVYSKEKTLDEIIMKMDNSTKRVIILSFFSNKRKGNVDGLFVNFFDKSTPTTTTPSFINFDDSIRTEVSTIGSLKTALNDFFIRQIYPRKDGGFIFAAESYYTTTRGNGGIPWSRYDYFSNNNYLTNYDYYNMGGRDNYWNSYDRINTNTTYYADNVLVLSIDKRGELEWSNAIQKSQKDDYGEDLISYQILLTGGSLHFLFNEKDRNEFLMYDNSVTPQGKVTRHPTLKNLDRRYGIMPRHGKQISAREMVFPCTYKNYICFAKIEY